MLQPLPSPTDRQGHVERPVKLFVTQPAYDHLCLEVARQVRQHPSPFDWIVCLSRGGLYAGNMLSRLLELPLGVMAVQTKSLKDGTQSLAAPQFSPVIASSSPVTGKVLLVDDLIESGKSITIALDLLQALPEVAEIKVAVLYLKTLQFTADFYAVQLEPPFPWIVQPFEAYEL